MAAQSGRVDAVKRLLDAGADPNQQAPGGPTALFVAAAAGHEDVIEVLLARSGARQHAVDRRPHAAPRRRGAGKHDP
jgi:ankyrin repeat protein